MQSVDYIIMLFAFALYKIIKTVYVVFYYYFFPLVIILLIYNYDDLKSQSIFFKYEYEVADLTNKWSYLYQETSEY